jgi:MinD superfamily P-loop ATPase
MIVFHEDICDHCGACVSVCPQDAIVLYESKIQLVLERCDDCRRCHIVCPVRAVEVQG